MQFRARWCCGNGACCVRSVRNTGWPSGEQLAERDEPHEHADASLHSGRCLDSGSRVACLSACAYVREARAPRRRMRQSRVEFLDLHCRMAGFAGCLRGPQVGWGPRSPPTRRGASRGSCWGRTVLHARELPSNSWVVGIRSRGRPMISGSSSSQAYLRASSACRFMAGYHRCCCHHWNRGGSPGSKCVQVLQRWCGWMGVRHKRATVWAMRSFPLPRQGTGIWKSMLLCRELPLLDPRGSP